MLAPWTASGEGYEAREASRALVRCAGPGAATELISVLRGRDVDALRNAHHVFWALGELGDEEAEPVLVEAPRHLLAHAPPSQGAPACAEALGKLRFRAAVDTLVRAASAGADDSSSPTRWDSQANLRLQSVLALSRIGDPRGIDAIIAVTDDPQVEIRRHAVHALSAFTRQAPDGHAADGHVADGQTTDGQATDERIVTRLIELCAGPYARDALPALRRVADPRAAPALEHLWATTGDPRTRRAAGRALITCAPGRRP